ncbi:hypothetical protein VV869_23310 [Photobacterium sp. MCCC 1A19761]|uniref:hypothetical protein n=1 Tax=Photobacterium sp. MCCC 1A19761 TaxID=3115000 RepID=UPI00307E472F
MSSVSKAIWGLVVANVLVLIAINGFNIYHHPLFLEGRNNTMLFSRGVTYTEDLVESYQEFFTVDHKWNGFHDLHSTIQTEGEPKSLKVYYSIYFWGPDIFSSRNSLRSKEYTPLVEPDKTEAHLIDEPVEQFFQILYQDRKNFCYTSLLTSSVQCVTADQ